MATLSTSYQDDILDSSMDGVRRYVETANSDGTISLTDATVYSQTGTEFKAADVNAITKEINDIENYVDTTGECGIFPNGAYSFYKYIGNASAGYVKLCQIKVTSTYANQCMEFDVYGRNGLCFKIFLTFTPTDDKDPSIFKFLCWGNGAAPIIHKNTTSTWDLYVYLEHTYGYLTAIAKGDLTKRVNLTWYGTYYGSSAPSDAITANFSSMLQLGATVGSATKPIYLSSGTLTASSSTVGSATKPIYLSSGTLTASSSTVGSATKPIYLSSGTLTASSSTVGGSTTPVYLNGGTLTAVSVSASGNRFGVISPITSDGVFECGKYIDFHSSDTDTSDYGARLYWDGTYLESTKGLHINNLYGLGQLTLQSGTSYFRIRNDGTNTYLMNGTSSEWTNYITIAKSDGITTFPSTVVCNRIKPSIFETTKSTTTSATFTLGFAEYQKNSSSKYAEGVTPMIVINSSSRRYKHDITSAISDENDPKRLYNLPVIQFKYNKDYISDGDCRYDTDLIGFIAEDVYDTYKCAADFNIDEETGEVEVDTWNPRYIVPAMLKLIQDQHKEIEELKTRVSELEAKFD